MARFISDKKDGEFFVLSVRYNYFLLDFTACICYTDSKV